MKTSEKSSEERTQEATHARRNASPAARPLPVSALGASNAWPGWRASLAATLLLLGVAGCQFYSFSGANIPEEYDSIAIVPINNETATQLDNLDGELTRLLNDRFVDRTRLRLETTTSAADVVLSGRLTGYSDEPAAISGGEQGATRNQVSIRAEIEYLATASDSLLIDKTYTQSETYDLNTDTEGARAAALVALQNIADAIFSDATSSW